MTVFLVNLLRILIVLVIVRLVLRFVAGLRRAPRHGSRTVPERQGGTLVRDPQCGTYVPESRAVAAGSHKFCSASCRDTWMRAQSDRAAGRAEATRV